MQGIKCYFACKMIFVKNMPLTAPLDGSSRTRPAGGIAMLRLLCTIVVYSRTSSVVAILQISEKS